MRLLHAIGSVLTPPTPTPTPLQPLLDLAEAEGCSRGGGNDGDSCSFYGPYFKGQGKDGNPYTAHKVTWTGARALAKARAWHAAALAGGWIDLHEKGKILELLIEWEGCAGLPLRERKAAALRIEIAIRAIHA